MCFVIKCQFFDAFFIPLKQSNCTSLIIGLVLAAYGINKFLIMWNYDDTNFNEFPVKNELSDREFSNEELQFQIAFLAFDQYYDTETL